MKIELNELRSLMMPYALKIPDYTLRIVVTSNLCWERYREQVKFVDSLAPHHAKVLDIGCGLGHTTSMLATLRPDLEVVGIDQKEFSIWKDLEKYCGCQFQVADALSLPFKKKLFDVVISFGVVEHVKDGKKFFHEIYRILTSGGYNIISNLPNRYALPEFLGEMLLGTSHERKYTKSEINALLTDAGFKDIRIQKEFIIPAHVDRVSKLMGDLFDKHTLLINRVDKFLNKVLEPFSESFRVCCRKL